MPEGAGGGPTTVALPMLSSDVAYEAARSRTLVARLCGGSWPAPCLQGAAPSTKAPSCSFRKAKSISCPLGLVHAWDSLCSGPIFSSASPSPSKPRSERVEWQHPFQQTSFGAWPTSPIPMLLRLSHAFYGSSAQHCKNLHKLQSLS